MQFVLTVRFASGSSLTVTCQHPELIIIFVEQVYEDAVVSWDARGK